ncbi:TadE/TadG family type IV pilus assembly protein [Rhodobacter calidifons]|uniref:Pilus assembly protein n=1 Tax=Rhodobacter calidifons TaxID=2715277 RepID=A0ABX0G6K9_9RHOB|nr:TadE family protein [Rhodobacter calidifons]NHB76928.1 pilus assembly protein [Rhodobacter calidifons]
MTAFRRFLNDDSGTATIEFLFVFPVVFLIFTASFESSMYMARYIMLERGVDEVIRQVRLGNARNLTHQLLKQRICESGLMVGSKADCMNRMRIWMQPVNTGNFVMAAPPVTCVDQASQVNTGEPPANEFAYGNDNDIMLLRICLKEWPMFPTSGISVKMPTQPDGSVAMIVTSVFVNEPG